jgi:hypothetical protein
MSVSSGPRIPTIRNSAYPYRDPRSLSWLTRADPITKLAICLAAVASIFCVCAAVAIAVGRATL